MAGQDDIVKIQSRRIRREEKTLGAMLRIFCSHKHGGGKELCEACSELWEYALARLHRCRFGGEKPTCARCPVHCYKPAMRERIREVMRFAGPKMLLRHPVLTFFHFLDGRRSSPEGGETG
jgi:hypothetical protein